jgi:excisionase family DNA binding protein
MPNNIYRNQNSQVSPARHEQFAENFSRWELSGRGWQIFDYEVELEPAFSEFASFQKIVSPVDDGRVSSLFGRLFSTDRNSNRLSGGEVSANDFVQIQPQPKLSVRTTSFRIYLPGELKMSPEQTEQLLLNLAASASFIGFEIIGTECEIILQISCPAHESKAVLSHLESHLPNVDWRETKDALTKNLHLTQTNESVTVDFGLGREWFVPLPFAKSFATDTFLPLIAAFEEIAGGETVCLQILFSRARGRWQQAAQEAIFDRNGKLVFPALQNHLPLIKEKLSNALLAAQIRFVSQNRSKEKSLRIARRTGAFFRQFSSAGGNELIPLQNDGLEPHKRLQSILSRTAFRSGMLLSAQELSAIVHLPSDSVKSKKLCRDENRTKLAPEFAARGNIVLGENRHGGQKRIIKLSNEQKLKHIWMTGASGCGKSTLITSLAEQDFSAGNGGCILEPHGDLIESVIARIPERRLKDVILFDPSDEAFPIGFNPLQASSELEKTLLSSDLVAIFQRFWTSQGDIISNVLHNAILAFLSSATGGTLVDLKHFIIDKDFRKRFLENVEDEEIRFYWTKEFPPLAGRITPLLTRLNLFLRSKLIRNIIAQTDNKLDFRRIMDERKILLVKLTHGAIGEENARLLGSFIIAKLYQAALSRQNAIEANRPPFFVSVDEAHHFLVPSMSLLLSGARKYGVGLLVSHQDTQQITSRDADILSSLATNCYARVCFRSDTDAEKSAKGFSFFTAEHLKNLGVGESICRFEQNRYDFNLKTFPLETVKPEIAEQRKKAVIEHTRKAYARPKAEVECEIKNNRQVASNTGLSHSKPIESIQNSGLEASAEKRQPAQPSASENPVNENHGRGGRHHQELQAVIKRMAESYGFSVEVEKSVLDGAGSVDVSLERENLKIACEVSVTSTTDYETRNILKCLAAGYDYAAVVVSNQKKLPSLNSKLRSEIPSEQTHKVKTFGLTGLLEFLRELAAPKKTPDIKREVKNGQRMTILEASEFLSVSPSALYRWVREGRVPFYRVGREYRFDRDELVLIGRHDFSGKRKPSVKLESLKIEKNAPKARKQQDERYRKLLKL